MTFKRKCLECSRRHEMIGHPSGLCLPCYLVFKQHLRDGDVQGVE